MNKEFVPYNEALALKELGFNMKTFAQYSTKIGDEWIISFNVYGEGQFTGNEGPCIAPTFSQAFRWFREKYELDYEIPPGGKKGEYRAFVKSYIYGNNGNNPSIFSYEEAELECLKKLIEIVKNNNNE
jgi:hypothetical protein